MRASESSGRTPQASVRRWGCVALLSLASGMGSGLLWADVDPWENTNRKIYAFNDATDRAVLKPLAKGYKWLFPELIRRGIHNIFRNIGTPAVALNQLLQGKAKPAVSDTGRFLINSTVGIAGVFDVATAAGLTEHEEDFGQTLVAWGVANGPFFTIPFRGPATTTHAVGMVVDSFTNPLRLISPARDRYIVYGVSIVETRAELLSAETLVAGDEYLFLRDAYLQRRDYLIHDGEIEDDPFSDDYDEFDE